ncbi:pentatricopeptide repeat-containing protein At1g09220, mitochondrial-like isoform X2 [Benincasa hispida]|uniref:pentatricopeptide repeat-containing protein At1g09220, mitochondrial-like isoform X2 n=1 Tax=Benincasa hispida TaxID=102211 RepID=UPI0018FF4B2B|nr:pentatricopeptide repeat-containing protein At1g09220, mitochondrial-like isoform X2 [Benincasa hispida]
MKTLQSCGNGTGQWFQIQSMRSLWKGCKFLSSQTFSAFENLQFLSFSSSLPIKSISPSAASNSLRRSPPLLISQVIKYATTHKATQRIRSFIITSGLLLNATTNFILLCNTLLHCYPLYQPLRRFPHIPPAYDTFAYSFLLHSCADLELAGPGLQLHTLTLKLGFPSHVYVQTAILRMYAASGFLLDALKVFDEMPDRSSVTWNVLITGLVKLGELGRARAVFDQMPIRNVVSWTAIIDGYTRLNRHEEAVGLFWTMVAHYGVEPTEITLLTIFPSISNLGGLKICQSVHAYAEKKGFKVSDIRIANSLIDCYAKCGCIFSASRVFEEMSAERKNLVSWTSIISGFTMHGMGKEAMESFEIMKKEGHDPNRVTFLSILSACSHGGLVKEGLEFFQKMVDEYQIEPDIMHYGSLIDMLGRAGRLEEAEKIALEIPMEITNVVIWRTLLGACSFHAGKYGDAEKWRRLMDSSNFSKIPGESLV